MSIRPLSILLAEDNEDHADLVVETFEAFNVSNVVHRVFDGEAVIKYLESLDEYTRALPDIILLDLKMPRLNGKQTLELLKTNDRFKHIPVIMLSTSNHESEIAECYTLGANSYLTKPVGFEAFSKKIKELNFYWVLTTELPS